MLYVKTSGKSQYGVWVIGELKTENVEINGIFSTDLKDIPETDKLEVKRLKISTSNKNKNIRFHLEIL